jgi:hypothetical protein
LSNNAIDKEKEALSLSLPAKRRKAKKQRKRFSQSNKAPLVVVGLCFYLINNTNYYY